MENNGHFGICLIILFILLFVPSSGRVSRVENRVEELEVKIEQIERNTTNEMS